MVQGSDESRLIPGGRLRGRLSEDVGSVGLWGLAQKTRGAGAPAPAALTAGLLEAWSAVGVGARTETEPRAGGARIAGWGLEAASAVLLVLPPPPLVRPPLPLRLPPLLLLPPGRTGPAGGQHPPGQPEEDEACPASRAVELETSSLARRSSFRASMSRA